ncbi:MAG TPA: pitrilysin family protein [Bryobacteraceae bacterium]|nr:pitrilysin family protein [Bryobacteraceae bacterium]
MKALFLRFAAAAGVSAFLLSAGAQTPVPGPLPAGVTRGASVEGITEYDLSNGLRVLLFPDPTKTSTTVNITYLVGSRNEDYGETGMAHLLEHMVFKGTPSHRNIPQELTEHGARPNGSTNADRTNYFETFEGSDVNLNWALSLESDRMINSFIAKKDLDSEMTVVRNEFEMGENSPVRILLERVLATAYLWHNYGKTTIGARSDIENVPIERLQAFYHRFYQPDNAVLTIAGHVDTAKTLALVVKYFGAIPKPTRILQKTYTEEPAQDGERTVTLQRVGDSKVVIVGVHVPALANPDGALGDLLGSVFANAPSGRLYKALVPTKKAGSVDDYETDSREPGMLLLIAEGPKTTDLDGMEHTFLDVMNDVEKNPPTAEEVNRSKTKLDTQFDLLLRNSERLGLFLSEYIAAGDWRLAFITRDRIQNATAADVDRFAKTYLVDSNRTIGLFSPTESPLRASIPEAPPIASLVDNYKGNSALSAGEVFDPSPANIDKRTVRGNLQPGIKLALISKKTRGNVVNATLSLHYGDENNLRDKDTAAELAGQMLLRGSAKYSRQQISDEFDKLKAAVRIMGGATGTRVTIQTTRPNLPAVLQLVAEVLREPAFSANEFDALKQEELTKLEAQRSEPDVIAYENASRHIHPYPKGDVRYEPTTDEQIANMRAATLADAKKFYDDFYGVAETELAVVGDFEPESLEKQVSTLFQDWKSRAHYAFVASNFKEVPAVNKSFETPDKANSTFIAIQPVKMDDKDPNYPALLLANYMLGGGFLNSRLATRIRVKDGLSYGIASQLHVSTGEDGAMFMTYAISAPQNTAHVESDFKEEVARAIQGGFTESEIAAAKSGWLQTRQMSRGQDNELTSRLVAQALWGRTMEWDAALESKVKALKAADVNAALKQYIDPAKISIFKAGDFAKTGKAPAAPPPTGRAN